MAFELPALPSFQTNIAPQPSVLDQYGKMLQLKALSGQQQLLPLQVQEAQQRVQQETTQNEMLQQEQESRKNMMDAISSGAFNKYAGVQTADGSGFDGAAAYQDLVANHKVLPQHATEVVQSMQKIAQSQAELAKTQGQAGEAQQNIRAKTLDSVAAKLGSIIDTPAGDAAKALDAFKQDLVKNPKAYTGLSQQELGELYGMDLEHLKPAAALLGLEGKLADFHKSKSEAAAAAQKVIPPGGGMSPDTSQQVQKDIAVATNPQIQQGKEQVAAAEGQARANIEAQVARGSNAALVNVPPHLVAPATADATKAGLDYAQAKSVSDRIQAMMDAAKKGNVVSYQLIPEEGALQVVTAQGIHRINMAEISNYGGGSLWQKLEGHLGKAVSGKSIPDSVLGDMAEIQKIMADGSRSKYENSLKTINQAYGANFKPAEMDAPSAQKAVQPTHRFNPKTNQIEEVPAGS